MAFVSVPKDLTKVKNKIIFSLLMLPAFLFAMYEKDGLPLEKVLKNMITVKFIRPPVRKYQMENLYEKKFIMVRKKKGGQKSVKKKKR